MYKDFAVVMVILIVFKELPATFKDILRFLLVDCSCFEMIWIA